MDSEGYGHPGGQLEGEGFLLGPAFFPRGFKPLGDGPATMCSFVQRYGSGLQGYAEVPEGGPPEPVALAEAGEGALLKRPTRAVRRDHVVPGHHAAGSQPGKGRLELPRHVFEGVQTVVMKQVNVR